MISTKELSSAKFKCRTEFTHKLYVFLKAHCNTICCRTPELVHPLTQKLVKLIGTTSEQNPLLDICFIAINILICLSLNTRAILFKRINT